MRLLHSIALHNQLGCCSFGLFVLGALVLCLLFLAFFHVPGSMVRFCADLPAQRNHCLIGNRTIALWRGVAESKSVSKPGKPQTESVFRTPHAQFGYRWSRLHRFTFG